jgi:hypothetical protein
MKITEFNFVGDFKSKTPNGNPVQYVMNDVVYYKEQTYIASKNILGSSPDLGEKAGWICLSKKQVLYELVEPPFYPKVGDEWLDKQTGILYKRIKNEGSEYWVEL